MRHGPRCSCEHCNPLKQAPHELNWQLLAESDAIKARVARAALTPALPVTLVAEPVNVNGVRRDHMDSRDCLNYGERTDSVGLAPPRLDRVDPRVWNLKAPLSKHERDVCLSVIAVECRARDHVDKSDAFLIGAAHKTLRRQGFNLPTEAQAKRNMR